VPEVYRNLADQAGPVQLPGYEEESGDALVTALVAGGQSVDSWEGQGEVEVVLDRTPFYGESGGQAGDKGVLTGEGFRAAVTDTTRPMADLVIHMCRIDEGVVRVGDRVTASVDHERRASTKRNHTATHLLQAALRDVLGEHVQQSGSLVEDERFRFDFTHFEALGPGQVESVEDIVNSRILENREVVTRLMSPEQAQEEGATALFGEKYGQTVRVISVPGVSMELCGGTHVGRTGDIGLFKITQESGIAAGVRRIEGVTGLGALARIRAEEALLARMAGSLKVTVSELPARIRKLQETVQEQEKRVRDLMRSMAGGGPASGGEQIREEAGVRFVAAELPGQDAAGLRDAADRIRDRIGSGVVVVASRDKDKAFLVVRVTEDLTGRYPAGEMVRRLAPLVGGGGGGRPDMAQAGGKDPDGLDRLLESVPGLIRDLAS
ncbi:MAG: alanine--tRNA ligase, partial [bacterium]